MSKTAALPPIIYGVVHLLGWWHQFPTPNEEMLWHVSLIVVTCSGLILVLFLWSIDLMTDLFGVYMMPAIHMIASGILAVVSFQ